MIRSGGSNNDNVDSGARFSENLRALFHLGDYFV